MERRYRFAARGTKCREQRQQDPVRLREAELCRPCPPSHPAAGFR